MDTPELPQQEPKRTYHSSDKSRASNRANSTHSTGPRTPDGKGRSRLNALKHGLLAREAVSRTLEGDETADQFGALTDRYAAYYQPEGPVEEMLVEKIAIANWRLTRSLRFETRSAFEAHRARFNSPRSCIDRGLLARQLMVEEAGLECVGIPDERTAALILRYEGAINRDLYRAMNELRRVQKERPLRPPMDPALDLAPLPPALTPTNKEAWERVSDLVAEIYEDSEPTPEDEVEDINAMVRGMTAVFKQVRQTNPNSAPPPTPFKPPMAPATPPMPPIKAPTAPEKPQTPSSGQTKGEHGGGHKPQS